MKVTDLPQNIKSDMAMRIKLECLPDLGSNDDIISAFLERSLWGVGVKTTLLPLDWAVMVRDFISFLKGAAWAIERRMQC